MVRMVIRVYTVVAVVVVVVVAHRVALTNA
jgi:hypothetical protein